MKYDENACERFRNVFTLGGGLDALDLQPQTFRAVLCSGGWSWAPFKYAEVQRSAGGLEAQDLVNRGQRRKRAGGWVGGRAGGILACVLTR